MTDNPNDTSDREIVIVRVLGAPRERAFAAWSEPNRIAAWWGPDGFTTTTHHMEFRAGGEWRFVMHGPDGRDYDNRIRYVEIDPPARLVYEQSGDEGVEPIRFRTTATFEDLGANTRLTLKMVFPSAEVRDHVVREYGAIEGGRQTLARLDNYLDLSASGPGSVSPAT